jgi:hypothetical protein
LPIPSYDFSRRPSGLPKDSAHDHRRVRLVDVVDHPELPYAELPRRLDVFEQGGHTDELLATRRRPGWLVGELRRHLVEDPVPVERSKGIQVVQGQLRNPEGERQKPQL